MKISVFICTYNRGKLISGTLKSLINNQTIKPDEIVVVPTIHEAYDIIEMEDIERDLGF